MNEEVKINSVEKVKDPRKVERGRKLLDDSFWEVVEREIAREILRHALQANLVEKVKDPRKVEGENRLLDDNF